MTEYYIPTAPSETEFVEKRSRFIGHVWPVESEEEARGYIEAMKKKYYDARHNFGTFWKTGDGESEVCPYSPFCFEKIS